MNRKNPPQPPSSGGTGGFGGDDALAWLAGRRPAIVPAFSAAPAPFNAGPVRERVRYAVLDLLRSTRSAERIAAAAAEMGATADQAWSDERPAVEARKQPGFACAAGCAWCCYQQVAVAPAEAIAIAKYVAATFSAAALALLKTRLAALDSGAHGLGPRGRARLKSPCAFLVDNACSIYPVRPLRCRGVYSRNAAHCRWAMETPDAVFDDRARHGKAGPYPVEPAAIADAALTGLAQAFEQAGLCWEALELTAALRVALDTPDLAERYAAGEAVFAGCELPPRGDDSAGLAKPPDSA